MSTVLYTQLELARLSQEQLHTIVMEEGWRPLDGERTATEYITYILNKQDGIATAPQRSRFTAGIMLAPINNVTEQLRDYYERKRAIVSELMELSDAALYAVIDSLGHELVIGMEGVMVNGEKYEDNAALVWFLTGLRSE